MGELEAIMERLSTLRAEAEEAEATSSELELEWNQAQGRLVLARRAVQDHEALLAAKQDELRAIRQEEALQRLAEAAARLADAISQVLVDLEAHENAEQAVVDLEGRRAGRPQQPDILVERWAQLEEAVRQRSDTQFADEVVEAAVRSRMPDAINSLPAHLREAARARVQARKRERQERAG